MNELKTGIYAIIKNLPIEQVIDIARKLNDDTRDESTDVLEIVLDYLDENLETERFVALCDELSK